MLDRRGLPWAGLIVGCIAVAAVTAWGRDAISALLVSALLAALLVSLAQHRAGRAHGQRLRMLVDNSSDAIIMQSIHGVISGWNPAAERIFGYARGEAIGHRLALFAAAADYVATITNAMATLSRGDASQAFDSVCLRKDGARFDVSIAASAITNAHGVITGIALTIRDTSAARAAERTLRELTGELEQQVSERTAMHAEAHRDLETILDALPSMIGYWDHNLINRFANRAYRDWYRNVHDPLVGCCLRDLLDGTIYLRHREEIDGALAGETQRFELEVAMPSGHGSRHLFVHYLPNRINGKVEGFYALIHDISEVKAAQRQVANSEEFLLRAEQVSGVGGWEVRLDTGRVTWTEQTRRIHEVADDFVPDMTNVLSFYPRDGRIALDEAFDDVLSTGRGWDLELPFATALGRTRWVRMVGEAEKVRGKPVRMIGAIQDITDQRRAAEALRQAILAAEAASAAKSSFLANMSHEIRTPLNAVIGLSYLLEQSQLDAEQRSFVAKIQVASRSLLGVINDVLDLSKIEAGEMVLEDAVFDLRALVHELAQLMTPQAEAKQLGLRVALPADLPAVIHGDATRVRQILTNFLSNAIKFTERGYVELAITWVSHIDDRATLRYAVRDTGIGISAEVQRRLFTPFTQADASTTRRFGGTGLGLSIVRRLAQLLGGDAGVDSEVGVGSEFWATLSHRVEATGEASAPASALDVMEVLIAEGDPAQRAALVAMARALGWRAEAVETGGQLIARVTERLTAGQPPDALVVDWKLPQVDGGQALAALAARFGRDRLPAVVIASVHDAATVQRAAGAELAGAVLTKPITSALLFETVNSSVARRGGLAPAWAALETGEVSLADIRVLVVDDSDINLEVARKILESVGARVDTCMNGQEAIDRLAGAPHDFDVVIMDVQMPIMDGNTATFVIRNELRLTLPILALTAGALVGERQRAFDAGMTDFLSKPLDPQLLLRSVRRHVARMRGTTPGGALLGAAAAETIVPAPAARPAWPAIAGIDSEDVAARLDHDIGLFTSMLAFLVREIEEVLEAPLDPRDPELAARLHKLKGSAATLGAKALRAAAAEGEAAARRAPTAADTPAKLRAIVVRAQELARHAHAFLATRAVPVVVPVAAGSAPTVIEGAAVQELYDLLIEQDVAAIDRFEALRGSLASACGAELAVLADAIARFEFELAADVLSTTGLVIAAS